MILSESSSAALRPTSGLAPAPNPLVQLDAQLDLYRRARHAQRLQVGVGNDELDAFHTGVNHAIDRIVAAAAHPNDLDLGIVAGVFDIADANVLFFHVRRHSK